MWKPMLSRGALSQEEPALCEVLLGSAEVARRGETARAARLLAAADALGEEMDYTVPPLELEQRTRIAAVLDGDEAALIKARSEGRSLTLDEAVAYALGEHP